MDTAAQENPIVTRESYDHWFGRQPPPEAKTGIGWRAIYDTRIDKKHNYANCPVCGVNYISPCRTKNGRTLQVPHKSRLPAEEISYYVNIDLVPDRGNSYGSESDRKALREWLNSFGVPWLEAECRRRGVPQMSDVVLRWKDTDRGYAIEASPQSSGGYIYIAAYKL